MSNYLAIATVTAALSQALREAIRAEFSGADVTNARPHSVNDGAATETASVNLYLYQVTRNTALSNADLPMRDSRGHISKKPAAAIDLHYLITFYGNQAELEPERLAGIVIRTMHTHSVLSRKLIQDTVSNSNGFPYLANSNLADSVEQVKFSPNPFSLEELSKLWSVFLQTSYTLSVAYLGTVVLIEPEEAPRSPLPVRDRNLYVRPFESAVIEDIKIQDSTGNSLQRADSNSILFIQGRGLKGDLTLIKVGGNEVNPPLADISAQEIRLDLSQISSTILHAGSLPLQVVHQQLIGTPPVPHMANSSNLSVVMLQPEITVNKVVGDGITTFEISVEPSVGKQQHVVLQLNELAAADAQPVSYALVGVDRINPNAPQPDPPADPDIPVSIVYFVINNADVKAADYLLRLQVDGVPSELTVVSGQFDGPRVSIP